MRLQNKVAVITGASLGIGSAIALALGKEGAAVAVDYRSHPGEAKEIVDQIEGSGGRAISVHADVSSAEDVKNLIQTAVREFGRLDVMVNNAGMEEKMPFLDTPLDVWNRTIAVNLTGAWLGCQEAARQMVNQGGAGRIINISSVHGLRASPFKAGYVSAKHGLEGLSKVIALEGGPHGVTSNTICPAYVRTPLVEGQIADQAKTRGIPENEVIEKVMLTGPAIKRLIEPEEVAEVAAFLCAPEASFINGASLTMDGGATATW